MQAIIRAEEARSKYREEYRQFLAIKKKTDAEIRGLDSKVDELRRQIDLARVRVENGQLCPSCDSYAVVPHKSKMPWKVHYAGSPEKTEQKDKTTYSCNVCGNVKRTVIAGAYKCPNCRNNSLLFVSRWCEQITETCAICGHSSCHE